MNTRVVATVWGGKAGTPSPWEVRGGVRRLGGNWGDFAREPRMHGVQGNRAMFQETGRQRCPDQNCDLVTAIPFWGLVTAH